MLKINFYELETVKNCNLKYAVIIAEYKNQWVFVRHKERTTWEIPGGHRENEEHINGAAARELFEETGAVEFKIKPICIYSVERDNEETYGQLFYASIEVLGGLPSLEIGEISLFDQLPENLTYPMIQPYLFDKGLQWLKENKS